MRGILSAVGLAAALAGAPALAQPRATVVQVDAVRREPLVQTVPVLGRLVPRQEGDVAARVRGPVARVAVEVGDRVEAGALLVELDGVRLGLARDLARAERDAARSEVQTASAEIEIVQQQRERLERLQASAAFTRAGLEDKLKEIMVATSRLEAARARLARAAVVMDQREGDLADGRITAPYPGVVTRRYVSPGAWAAEGEPVVALIDDGGLEIEADVPGDRAADLEPGATVDLEIAGEVGAARIRAVVPVENPLTRTRAVRFVPDADTAGRSRIAGQSVMIRIPASAPRELVTVHKDAVSLAQGRRIVFVAKDGQAQERQVELGVAAGARFEVLSGLEPGELVVVRGNERLRPGQAIAAEPAPDVPAPPAAAVPAGVRS